MAAPPDLINDPPSLICRYKDRRQGPDLFLRSPSVSVARAVAKPCKGDRRSEQEDRGVEATFISVRESKREKERPGLLPSLLLL